MSSLAEEMQGAANDKMTNGNATAQIASNLLELPPELQLMILGEVYADMPRDRHGRLKMVDGGWKPPPILQVCQHLRDLGLPDFSKQAMSLRITDFDAKDHIAHERWLDMLGDQLDDAIVDFEFHIDRPTNQEAAAENLMTWVKYWYENGKGGLMLKADQDEGFEYWGDTCLVLDKTFQPGSQIHRISKVFAAAYKLDSAGVEWTVAESVLKAMIALLMV